MKGRIDMVRKILLLIGLMVLVSACSSLYEQSSTTPTPLPSETPSPTFTMTPTPTSTIAVPTPYPLPTLPDLTGDLPVMTICKQGCAYRTVQAAIDDATENEVTLIEIQDALHTEAGITVNKDVIIRGLGVKATTIQSGETPEDSPDRVFHISRGAEVIIQDLTIQHGNPSAEEQNGGGIRNYGSLTLVDCLIQNNSANGGGGISTSGDLTIIGSTIADNTAVGIAPIGMECGNGGGIQCGNGTLLILNSTVSGNQGGVRGRARGGGIMVGCSCQATLINSTISGNKASREGGRTYAGGHSLGGGIFVAGELQLIHSTIADNQSTNRGSGIMNRGRMDYTNTIIADNKGGGGNCVSGAVEIGSDEIRIGANLNNLVEGGGCEAQFDEDPMLTTLGDFGGNTQTHALSPDSPAVDAIPNELCPYSFDQRGEDRPAPSSTDSTGCDLGSFEYHP